jgi:hypothetical protein
MIPESAPPSARGELRALSATLIAGAVYDAVFAFLFVAAPSLVASPLGLPLPGAGFYGKLIAVLLTIVAAVYLVAARDPERSRPLVVIAIGGRLLGFAVLAGSTFGHPELGGLWAPALVDLGFGVAHLVTGRRLLA